MALRDPDHLGCEPLHEPPHLTRLHSACLPSEAHHVRGQHSARDAELLERAHGDLLRDLGRGEALLQIPSAQLLVQPCGCSFLLRARGPVLDLGRRLEVAGDATACDGLDEAGERAGPPRHLDGRTRQTGLGPLEDLALFHQRQQVLGLGAHGAQIARDQDRGHQAVDVVVRQGLGAVLAGVLVLRVRIAQEVDHTAVDLTVDLEEPVFGQALLVRDACLLGPLDQSDFSVRHLLAHQLDGRDLDDLEVDLADIALERPHRSDRLQHSGNEVQQGPTVLDRGPRGLSVRAVVVGHHEDLPSSSRSTFQQRAPVLVHVERRRTGRDLRHAEPGRGDVLERSTDQPALDVLEAERDIAGEATDTPQVMRVAERADQRVHDVVELTQRAPGLGQRGLGCAHPRGESTEDDVPVDAQCVARRQEDDDVLEAHIGPGISLFHHCSHSLWNPSVGVWNSG